MSEKTIENYMKFIKEIEQERNQLMCDVFLKKTNHEVKQKYLEKYDQLLASNYCLLYNIVNDEFLDER